MIVSRWPREGIVTAPSSAALRRPGADRPAIALRHRQALQLADGEEAKSAMFAADPHRSLIQAPNSVGHDDHLLLRQNFVYPAIHDRGHGNIGAKLFGKFA